MTTRTIMQPEKTFSALPQTERDAIISYGVAMRLSDLNKRLFLAQSKIHHFEEKYATTLVRLEEQGLADDAGYETHEDYLRWHHWSEAAARVKKDVAILEEIAAQGLYGTSDGSYSSVARIACTPIASSA